MKLKNMVKFESSNEFGSDGASVQIGHKVASKLKRDKPQNDIHPQ